MNKINYYRKKQKMTIKELHEKSKVSAGYLSMLERDEEGLLNPTMDVMQKISKALKESVPEVFYPKDDKK